MAGVTPSIRRLMPIALVSITVALQLVAAWVLGYAAQIERQTIIIAATAIGVAIGLHAIRFVVWGYAHRRFPLSHTYPLTALFFPFVLVLSYLQGDDVGPAKIIGVALITFGVGLLAFPRQAEGVSVP